MDISKCEGENCLIRQSCKRFTSKANEYHQSYIKGEYIEGESCEFFWDNKN